MIYTLTLNPAIDKILYIDCFKKNISTRINKVINSIGGKGTHVSINLNIMGDENCAVMITHGTSGIQVEKMMRDFGVPTLSLHKDNGMTRTNYLISEATGDSTLITERGEQLSDEDINEIIYMLNTVIKKDDILVIAGTAANHPDLSVYNTIIKGIKPRIKCFLDTSGDYLLKTLESGVFAIKPNLDELSMVSGKRIEYDEKKIVSAIEALSSYNIPLIAVSLGSAGSIARYYDDYYQIIPPKVNVKNTVGCGDCYMAGLVHGYKANLAIEDTLRYATAVSAAKAESELSVGFDPERAKQLEKEINISKI